MPISAEYLSHMARTPFSVSGPRSPTKSPAGLHRRAGIQVYLQGHDGQAAAGERTLLVAFAQPENHGATTLA